jgi:hypothetical protein
MIVEYRVPDTREAMAGVCGGFVVPYRVLNEMGCVPVIDEASK